MPHRYKTATRVGCYDLYVLRTSSIGAMAILLWMSSHFFLAPRPFLLRYSLSLRGLPDLREGSEVVFTQHEPERGGEKRRATRVEVFPNVRESTHYVCVQGKNLVLNPCCLELMFLTAVGTPNV